MSAQIERGQIAAEAIGKHFTTIFNGAIRDRRTSWKTKGVLAWLLSHQEGFQFSVKAIVAAGPDGEAAVRSALKELETFGYLTLKKRPRDKGKITGNVYRVTDMPTGIPQLDRYLGEISDDLGGNGKTAGQSQERKSKPVPTSGFSDEENGKKPCGGFPHVVDPHVVDPAHKKTTFEEDHVSPDGETEEEHSLRSRSETALPGGACEPGGSSDDLLDRLLAEFADGEPEPVPGDGGASAEAVVNLPGGGALIRGEVVGPAADASRTPQEPSAAPRGFNGHVPGCCCPDCLRSRQKGAQGLGRGPSVPRQPDRNRHYGQQ